MFLKNAWYAAGWSSELAPTQLLARKILGTSVVLFRTAAGILSALEDRCRHRGLPLSCGHVDREIIRCAYHGLEYGADGICTRIPSQEMIPPTARVRAFPVREQDALIWIWMGDAALADPAAIPRHPIHGDPQWAWRSAHYRLGAAWTLVIDNLMDLSHLPYIHPHTIGGDPQTHFQAKMETRRTAHGVFVQRQMPNSQPPPTYVAARGFQGKVDRWQEIEFMPVMLRIHTGACELGDGAYDGRRQNAFSMIGFHGITPETETTTHYFWSIATNVLTPGVADTVFEQTARTFREDELILEQQQRRLDEDPEAPLLDIAGDIGANLVRRQLKAMFKAELAGGTGAIQVS